MFERAPACPFCGPVRNVGDESALLSLGQVSAAAPSPAPGSAAETTGSGPIKPGRSNGFQLQVLKVLGESPATGVAGEGTTQAGAV